MAKSIDKRRLIVALIMTLITVLLLVGCTTEQNKETNFREGFVDITVDFYGAEQGFRDDQLEHLLVVRNGLGYDLNNVHLSIGAFNRRYLKFFFPETAVGVIEKNGAEQELGYNVVIVNSEEGAASFEQNYRLYVDYDSHIVFSADKVCVGPQRLYESIDSGQCSTEREENRKFSYKGQGAPLGVTKMEVVPASGQDVQLILNVENKGEGTVGEVSVNRAMLGSKEMECEFRGSEQGDPKKITFGSTKNRELVCKQTVMARSAYPTTIFIEFAYDYRISFQDKLTIRG